VIDIHIIDTHALIWHLEGNPKLGKSAKKVFDDAKSKLILPTIVLAEAIDIVQKGRTMIMRVNDLLQDVFGDSRIEIEPLTIDVLLESLNASAVPEMHDRLITATALFIQKQGFSVTIVTKDDSIIDSKLVNTVW
jgi:PIN domain nuclease of toxin-antitoxin system